MANYSRFDYVKKYEHDDSLLRDCWIVVRIDGHEFRSFSETHKFEKPNDPRALKLMNYCAIEVMKACGGMILAFGDSDEYNFVLKRNCELFNRRASKLATFISSTFTANYIFNWSQFFPSTSLKYPPVFNGRATAFPTNKSIRDYLSWRQTECHVRNLYDTCFWGLVQKSNFTAKEAEGKLEETTTDTWSELLFTSCGIIYTKLPDIFRRGSIVVWSEDKDQEKESDSLGTKRKSKLIVLHEDLITQDFYDRHPGILPGRRVPLVKESYQKEPEKVDVAKKDSEVILSLEHRRTGSAQFTFSTPRGPEPLTSAFSPIATPTPDGTSTEQAAMYGIPDSSNFGQRVKIDPENPYAVMPPSSFTSSPLVCDDCGAYTSICSCSSRDATSTPTTAKSTKGTRTPPIITTTATTAITATTATTATTTLATTITTTATTTSTLSTTTSGKLRKETPTPTPGETPISPYSLFGSTNFGRTSSASGENDLSKDVSTSPKTPALNAPSTTPYAPLPSTSFTIADTHSDPASIYRPVASSNFEGLSALAESQRLAAIRAELMADVSDDGTPSPHSSSPLATKISRSQSSASPVFETTGGQSRLPPPSDRATSLQRSYSSQSTTSSGYTTVETTTRPERRKSLPTVRTDSKLDALQEIEELDIDIEAKDFYKAAFERSNAQETLEGKPYGTYLFRPCSDPHEFIDNKPNPNLFVLSYCGTTKMANVKVFRFPGQGLGNRRDPSKCTVYRTITSFVRNVLCGQTGAPVSDDPT